jgi:DnaJ-class molecular chaperone
VSDPYKILGVDPFCSDQELKRRYYELAQQHHPDHGGHAEVFRQIHDAYKQILASPRPARPAGVPPPPQQPHDDFEPLFEDDENMIVAHISATVKEIREGKIVPLMFKRAFKCLSCHAEKDPRKPMCRACNGRGYFHKMHYMTAFLTETKPGSTTVSAPY